jgi:uncharacterized protein DUF3313
MSPSLRLALCVLPLLAVSCRNVRPTQTGFLTSYEGLQETDEPGCLELRGSADWSGYDQVLLEPMQVQLVEDSLDQPLGSDVEDLSRWYHEHLVEAFESTYKPVEEAGPRTIRVRSVLSELDRTNLVVNWITMIILMPFDTGGATMEFEITDAQTG